MNNPSNIVDSLLHPCAALVRELLGRAQRKALNRFLIDDEENIVNALSAGIVLESVFYAGEEVISPELRQKLPSGTKIYEVAKRTCKKIFENDKISRVFAIAKTPQPASLDSLGGSRKDIVIMEDVSIAGNVGAIVRTAAAFGIGGIVLTNVEPVDVYDRRLIRASRGLLFSLPIVAAPIEEVIRFCRQRNLTIAVTDPHGHALIDELSSVPRRLVIAFGAEKTGCSAGLAEAAGLKVKIPTLEGVESLNVSAAASIALYSRFRFNTAAAPA